MTAADRNGAEMVRNLSIQYNRERQAKITPEITEVASGARAQKKAKALRESQDSERRE